MLKANMAYLETDNAKIYYEKIAQEGDGTWITLVNGHMRSSRDFRLLRNQLGTLGFKILVLDNRDAGLSTSDEDYEISDMCDDIIKIWDNEGIDQSCLLGISMGGLIAQAACLKYPSRVSSLILVSTFAGAKWLGQSADWGRAIEENVDVLKKYVSTKFYDENTRLVEIMAEQITKDIVEQRFLGRSKRQRNATQSFSINDGALEAIKCPSLIVHGEQDRIVKLESAEYLQKQISNSKLIEIRGAGHLLLAECSGDLFDAIKEFLRP